MAMGRHWSDLDAAADLAEAVGLLQQRDATALIGEPSAARDRRCRPPATIADGPICVQNSIFLSHFLTLLWFARRLAIFCEYTVFQYTVNKERT